MTDLKKLIKLTMGTESDRLIVKELLLNNEELFKKYGYLCFLIGTTSRSNDFEGILDINSYDFYNLGSLVFEVTSEDIKIRIQNLLI